MCIYMHWIKLSCNEWCDIHRVCIVSLHMNFKPYHIHKFARTHLRCDAVHNETEVVWRGILWRTISNRFIDSGDGASTRILTLREFHIEEDITWWWTVIYIITILLFWAHESITTAIHNAIFANSCLQIVFILKAKQLNIQQQLTLSFLQNLVTRHALFYDEYLAIS